MGWVESLLQGAPGLRSGLCCPLCLHCSGSYVSTCLTEGCTSWALPLHRHSGCPHLPESCCQGWALNMQCHLTKHWLTAANMRRCPTRAAQTGSMQKGKSAGLTSGWAQCLGVGHQAWAHLVLFLELLGCMLIQHCREQSREQSREPHSPIPRILSSILPEAAGNV